MDRRNNGLVDVLTRTPLPSVESYIALSGLIFTISTATLYNTFTTHPELHLFLRDNILTSTLAPPEITHVAAEVSAIRIIYYILNSQALTWVLVNSYFAALALLAKFVIAYAFKELSRQEAHTVRQGFFSFFLFHIVFLSVVASASHSLIPWLIWFGGTAFLTVIHEVAHQRFKFVSPSAGLPGDRLSWICFFLFVITTSTLIGLCKLHHLFSFSHFLFLLNDIVLAWVRSTHGLIRCVTASDLFKASPDQIRHFVYYLNLGGSVLGDCIQLSNYLHLMVYSPFGFNLTCVFFVYHMRLAYQSITTAIHRHQKHKSIFTHIQTTYPSLSESSAELCIVCWEELQSARKLPCDHAFHDWCLMWWLEQDSSCPTCRRPVSAPVPPPAEHSWQSFNPMWRFGGERFDFLRIPIFPIDFSHNPMGLMRRQDDSQLTTMAEQVREMFPQLALESILEDLRMSGSTQSTIENILEGRVGFVQLQDESDEDSLRDDMLPVGPAGDAGLGEDEIVDSVAGFEAPRVDGEQKGTRQFFAKKNEMIKMYRKRYLDSSRGSDLRAKEIFE